MSAMPMPPDPDDDHLRRAMSRRQFLPALAAVAMVLRRPGHAHGQLVRHRSHPHPHPEPRPGITGAHVLDTADVRQDPAVAARYADARAMPEVFDGLYCYCNCQTSMGHRSLLACYESDQPIGCYMCQNEAELAADLHRKGKSLAAIRAEVDRQFASD